MGDDAADGLDLVLFHAGPWCLAAQAAQIQASRSPAPQEQLTLQVEALLGLPRRAQARQALCLKLPAVPELEVAGPLELLRVEGSLLHPLPPLLAQRCPLPGLRALLTLPGRPPVAVMDLFQLIQHA